MSNILKYLVIDVKQTIGDTLLLLGIRPYMSYKEGVRGEQEGLTFTVLSEALGYEKVDIKIAGIYEAPIPFDGSPMHVSFEGMEGKLWQDWSAKGEVKLSLSAREIKAAGKNIRLRGELHEQK
ncbi:MAG: hypothetical protein SOX11_11855 [Lachnospiraceae bacterium]|nr:hypothetical protein [Lachnospiraceae bacterium]MDY3223822.1 hypothetical protein [Lachnospiraceae bacterium]